MMFIHAFNFACRVKLRIARENNGMYLSYTEWLLQEGNELMDDWCEWFRFNDTTNDRK